MDVQIVWFPETRVALIEHHGPPALEHETVRKLVAWKLARGLRDPARYRSYGVHHTDPRTIPPEAHRVTFCLSLADEVVEPNDDGIGQGVIPALRCARVRHLGSRANITAAAELCERWLPASGEHVGSFPLFFHYVNVGPQVTDEEMVTDVYLPLR